MSRFWVSANPVGNLKSKPSAKTHLVRHWLSINTLLSPSGLQAINSDERHDLEFCYFRSDCTSPYLISFLLPDSRSHEHFLKRSGQGDFSAISSQGHSFVATKKKGFKATTASRSITNVCMLPFPLARHTRAANVYLWVEAATCLPRCHGSLVFISV